MPYLLQGDEPGLENCILVSQYRVPDPTMDSGGVDRYDITNNNAEASPVTTNITTSYPIRAYAPHRKDNGN